MSQKQGIGTFLKIAAFWFLLFHATTILANTLGVSAKPLAYFAIGGFAIHCLLTASYTLGDSANSSRLLQILGFCIIASLGMGLSQGLTFRMDLDDFSKQGATAVGRFFNTVRGTGGMFIGMESVEHLAAAARLVFREESERSLEQAQLHLRAISPAAPEYSSAKHLLDVAVRRVEELRAGNAKDSSPPLIQILKREQIDTSLFITLRNNGTRPVKNIAYDVSFFEAATGLVVGTQRHSRIPNVLQPQETWTIEIPQDTFPAAVHTAFGVIGWETGS